MLEPTVVPRVLVVVEDDLPRQVVSGHGTYSPMFYSNLEAVAFDAHVVGRHWLKGR
jgi:hypothetical protein